MNGLNFTDSNPACGEVDWLLHQQNVTPEVNLMECTLCIPLPYCEEGCPLRQNSEFRNACISSPKDGHVFNKN